ncbi:hypothetical protein HYV81_06430 [Candidatus Woesearchaeota archaeon]|nr:hypothetical protein [Candidatus Woesearchaeota archaeon]
MNAKNAIYAMDHAQNPENTPWQLEKKKFFSRKKLMVLLGILIVYIAAGLTFAFLFANGIITNPFISKNAADMITGDQSKASLHLSAAESFTSSILMRADGHINLYIPVSKNASADYSTNSEAMSYYLLWTAKGKDKEAFDNALGFVEQHMLHPVNGHLMWHIEANGTVAGDGANIATDADLRAIKALLIAENQWGDARYTRLIEKLAIGIEQIAVTNDTYLAPYAGLSGRTADAKWTAKEVWLSYSDFTVFKELAQRRGGIWISLYDSMKEAVLKAQIHNGLYNSMLTEKRQFGNGIDGGGYSINSMWIMVRSAESDDPELQAAARKSLEFYKGKFGLENQLFALYSSNGDAFSPNDSPWVYALVGRAAVALGDYKFADAMVQKLTEFQVMDKDSPHYGAIPEGDENERRIGQFTMQESILTLQDYVKSRGNQQGPLAFSNKADMETS